MGIARTHLMGEIYYSLCTLATFSAKKKKKGTLPAHQFANRIKLYKI